MFPVSSVEAMVTRMRKIIAALFALLLTPLLAHPAAAQRADWARTVTVTPEGAYVLGNPKAPRLVEYVSYTCPHCAHFVAEASAPLQTGWVRRGLLGIEVRHAVRDPYDLAAAVLVRCGGKPRFFGDHNAVFLSQQAWLESVQKHDALRSAQASGDVKTQLADIAEATGLAAFFEKRGLAPERQRACLADTRAVTILGAMAREAWEERRISGTPAFLLDGRLLDASGWAELQPQLPGQPRLPGQAK